MRSVQILAVVAALGLCGCVKIKNEFRPGIQREPVPERIQPPRLSVLAMTDQRAPAQFQADIDTILAAAPFRWTGRNPAVKLLVPGKLPLKLKIDAAVPELVFKETGPISAAVAIDGRAFDTIHFTATTNVKFEKAVPPDWLHPADATEIAMTIDKGYRDPETGRIYCLQLARVALEP